MEGIPREPRRSTRAAWIAVVVVGFAAGALLAWWYRSRPAAPPAEAPAAAPPAEAPLALPPGPPPTVDPARVRSLLESVSPSAAFRSWLAHDDLVRRWAAVTANLAQGESPRTHLGFLAPARPFSAAERGGRTFIAPASYQRYDGFADAVASVDAAALARVYRELHPVLEGAYRALGYPGGSLDRATARALGRLASVPIQEGEVALEGKGGVYAFADPRLEALGPVEKHLLRMGPRNGRLIQAKASEIEQALGLPPAGPGAGR
jgi:hypothetical protein